MVVILHTTPPHLHKQYKVLAHLKKKMDGLLFRDVKRRRLLCERYSMGHQSIFATNAAALESKRDVIHSLRDIGGRHPLPRLSFGVFELTQTLPFCIDSAIEYSCIRLICTVMLLIPKYFCGK
jgi:hypothetical protein